MSLRNYCDPGPTTAYRRRRAEFRCLSWLRCPARPTQTFVVNIRQPSCIRDALGFTAGGILAGASAGLAFVAFIPLGNMYDGRNHVPEALMVTVLVMFFCGFLEVVSTTHQPGKVRMG